MDFIQKLGLGLGFVSLFMVNAGAQQTAPANVPVPQRIQFNRDIRPILSENCFTCHGPDRTHRTTVFRFDVEESAKQDLGKGHYAIFPGDPDKSAMVQRITAADVKRRMPPASTGRKLSDGQIALLKEWIKQGAPWEKHWSFQTPKRPAPPRVANTAWIRNPIDNFILSRLEQEGLKPSPEADRAMLLRRVSLDLTGKGPTLAEMDAFVADKSPNAYEKVVDRLLQSPHYGERMARPWLDAARYADTSGYQQDHERYQWRWRDWVIQAFNKNMPFDQFTVEQLAGDLLPNPTLDQKIATGFNRNHRTNAEGGIVAEEFAVEYVVDRVATTSSVFLGLTLGCARCHDHKYDPFTQKEFYQMFAYYNNVPELGHSRRGNTNPYIKAPTPEQQAGLKKIDDQIAATSARLAKLEPTVVSAENNWLKSLANAAPLQWAPARGPLGYYPLDGDLQGTTSPAKDGKSPQPVWKGTPQFASGLIGQAASFDGTNSIEIPEFGNFDYGNKFTLSAWIRPTSGTGAIVGKFQYNPQGRGYTMQLKDGKVEVIFAFRVPDHALRVETERPIELNQWHHVMATYAGSPEVQYLTVYVDGVKQPVKVVMDILTESSTVKGPFRIGGAEAPEYNFHGLIDDVRVFNSELTADEAGILASGKTVNELGQVAATKRTSSEGAKIRQAFVDNTSAPADYRQAFRQLAALRNQRAEYYDNIPTVMVMEELPAPRETHLLERGAYDAPGEIVTAGVPAMLPAIPPEFPKNRLGLARWLVDPSNPLTARVTVNRYWQMLFGTGIVKTVDDFGSQGDSPSHPELLDWLATEFIRTGWNVKQMQRTMVMSAVYRQSSPATPELVQKDPENRLLAHGPRFRLPAEIVRDQALAMAGLLVEKQGGPSVKPYQPEGLWSDLTQQGQYVQDHGEGLYRRSLYTFWKRTIPPPSMANFDAPTRESCIVQRGFTNSPLQALDLMNDVTYLEASRVLAERMIKEGGTSPDQRIAFAFRLATGRRPTAQETRILAGSLNYASDRFQTRPENAEKFLSAGEHPRDTKLDAKELAAYTSVASLIINLDETVTKE